MSTHSIMVRSREREELVEFTAEVSGLLSESRVREGVCVLFVRHTTAGLTVNENADPDVPRDMLHCLRTLIPQHGMGFKHGEQNSDAHIKATLVGFSVNLKNELAGTSKALFAGKLNVKRYHNDFAPLSVAAWFRGQSENQTVAYLFYKGKQVGSTATTSDGR